MGKTPITPALIKQLRRDAKRLKQDKGIPLHEALDQLAAQHGFKNWSWFMNSARSNSKAAQFVANVANAVPNGELQRHYLHGDYSEVMPRQCYCAQCELFVPADHFVSEHGPDTLERYLEDKRSWDEWKTCTDFGEITWRREENAPNTLAIAAQVYAAVKEQQRSDFHRWLSEQQERDDQVGDIAKEVLTDKHFPTAEKTLEGMLRYLEGRKAHPDSVEALKWAFSEYELG